MANFDFKTATPDTSIAGTEYWFGADSQSAATPSIYSVGGLKSYLLGGGSLAITAAKTLTASNSLTLSGTDGTTMTFPSSSATLAGLGIANLFTTAQTISPTTDVPALTARSSSGGTVNILQLQDSSNNVLAAFDKDGLLTLGRGSGLTGQLKFANATNNNVLTLQAGATSGSLTFTLPTADGTSGQVLQTNGSGVLSWKTDATNSPGGSDTQVQFNNSGSFGADSTLTFNSTSKLLSAQRFGLSGNISSAAWTTNGIRYSNSSATITDTSSSGTVATAYTNVYGGNTIAASNSTTFTNYYNTYIAAPVSGTNVTFTNAWALGLGGAAQIAGGTLNGTVLDISQAWSGTGTYTGIKYNVSADSGPANYASALLDLQVGGSRKAAILKDGSVIAPLGIYDSAAKSYSQTTGLGFFFYSNGIAFLPNTVSSKTYLSSTALSVSSDVNICFTSTSSAWATADVILSRRGAANLRLGAADAAAPVAQTLSVQSVVAGTTNTAGTNFTITGSQGTGTGAGGDIIFQTAAAGSSGTSQNSLTTALQLLGSAASDTTTLNTGSRAKLALQVNGTTRFDYGVTNALSTTISSSSLYLNTNGFFLAQSNYLEIHSSDINSGIAILGNRGAGNVPTSVELRYGPNSGTIDSTSSIKFFRKTSGSDTTVITLDNSANVIFNTGIISFAGTTSSFPALKRSSTTLQVRLADDSADAPLSAANITSSGNITANGSTSVIGYATGSGGAVTQATDRTTGVTLNKSNGAITLVSAAGTTSWQTFTVTNSTVAATDTVIVSQKSGTDKNQIFVTAVAAGSFDITFATTGGTTTEQPVFNFAVIKAVAA